MDEIQTTHAYRIGFGNYNAFFGAWVKRGFFTKRRLFMWLGLAFVMMFFSIGGVQLLLSQINKTGQMPAGTFNGLFWGIMAVATIVTSLLFSAFIVYVLTLPVIYMLQVAAFLVGGLRRRTQGIAVSAQHVTKTVDEAVSETPWPGVHTIVSTRQTILIFTSRNSAMVIPKSAFDTPEGADRFVVAAQHFWLEATGGPDAKKHPEAHF